MALGNFVVLFAVFSHSRGISLANLEAWNDEHRLERHLHHQTEGSDRFFWHRLRWFALSPVLSSSAVIPARRIGAGAGLLGSYLARDFPLATYRFVEPIEFLKHHLIDRYGDAADATTDNDYQSAQFVTAMDVLEHQLDDHAFMRTLVGRIIRERRSC